MSLQLRILRLGLLQDGDVGVRVFPGCEEILVGGAYLDVVFLEHISASGAEVGQWVQGAQDIDTAMIENFLVLGQGPGTITEPSLPRFYGDGNHKMGNSTEADSTLHNLKLRQHRREQW